MDDWIEKMKQDEKVIAALTHLALSFGTFLAVIKMVAQSLIQTGQGKKFPLLSLIFYHNFI